MVGARALEQPAEVDADLLLAARGGDRPDGLVLAVLGPLVGDGSAGAVSEDGADHVDRGVAADLARVRDRDRGGGDLEGRLMGLVPHVGGDARHDGEGEQAAQHSGPAAAAAGPGARGGPRAGAAAAVAAVAPVLALSPGTGAGARAGGLA